MRKPRKIQQPSIIRYNGRKFTPYNQNSRYLACTTGLLHGECLTGIFDRMTGDLITPISNGVYFLEYHSNGIIARVYQNGKPDNQGFKLA